MSEEFFKKCDQEMHALLIEADTGEKTTQLMICASALISSVMDIAKIKTLSFSYSDHTKCIVQMLPVDSVVNN